MTAQNPNKNNNNIGGNITLYGYCTSPFVRKTAAFLYYKGLDFTHVPVNPVAPQETIGFTEKTQVPVLKIGDEWRLESSDHGHWLDALFPERPLCPAAHKDKIVALDKWANGFYDLLFRSVAVGQLNNAMRFRLWRMAELLHAQTPLPNEIRQNWPIFVYNAPFIKAMADHMDLNESMSEMQQRMAMEFVAKLEGWTFLGGFDTPNMADLAIFSTLAFAYMVGLEDEPAIFALPPLKAWFLAMREHLPDNPVLVEDFQIVHPLSALT